MLWFLSIMRQFFLSIDLVLASFVAQLYDFLLILANTSVLSQGTIQDFAGRIELLLGIFMLFKVSFSLITYIVNPDDFSDKSKGFGKLIGSTVISLVLLILVPYIFNLAFTIQSKVLEGNILAKIFFGNTDSEAINTAGEDMAFYAVFPFFKPNTSLTDELGQYKLTECINLTEVKNDKLTFNDECANKLYGLSAEGDMQERDVDNYIAGVENRSVGLLLRVGIATTTYKSGNSQQFVMDYSFIITSATCIIIALLLITYCIDIGIRSVKLAMLQLIYPIPVISFMDPKSGKEGLFKKWWQMCLTTYLSLFLRLIALFFGIYIISQVGLNGLYNTTNGSQITNGWVTIFVIIGVLFFIKELPKILEGLGFKLDGGFNLNPLKRIAEGAILGGIAGKAAGKAMQTGKKAAVGTGRFVNTGRKKFVAGMDAKRNGYSFRSGSGQVKGTGWMSKFGENRRAMRPYSTEAKQKALEADKERRELEQQLATGKEAYKKAGGDINKVKFSSDRYAQSVQNVANKKEALKTAKTNYELRAKNIDREKESISSMIKRENYDTEQAYKEAIKNANYQIDKSYILASEAYDKAQRDLDNAKEIHEQLQSTNLGDAKLEKAFKIYDDYVSMGLEQEPKISSNSEMSSSALNQNPHGTPGTSDSPNQSSHMI